jgi:hypothetical protein
MKLMVDKLDGKWSNRGYWRAKAKRIAWFLGHQQSAFRESSVRGKGSVSYCKNCYKYMEDYFKPFHMRTSPEKDYTIWGDVLHGKCDKPWQTLSGK